MPKKAFSLVWTSAMQDFIKAHWSLTISRGHSRVVAEKFAEKFDIKEEEGHKALSIRIGEYYADNLAPGVVSSYGRLTSAQKKHFHVNLKDYWERARGSFKYASELWRDDYSAGDVGYYPSANTIKNFKYSREGKAYFDVKPGVVSASKSTAVVEPVEIAPLVSLPAIQSGVFAPKGPKPQKRKPVHRAPASAAGLRQGQKPAKRSALDFSAVAERLSILSPVTDGAMHAEFKKENDKKAGLELMSEAQVRKLKVFGV